MSRQDVENFAPRRIELLGEFAASMGFTQAILFAHCQETGTVVTTWGADAEWSARAAAKANFVKKLWNWTAVECAESQKVQALRDRIAELEREVQYLGGPL